ncbi:hypothetical protein D9R19_00160 [Corynebacterium diphtheriae]|nr:hypothetical protein D9R19_00160 [Corynebacterium diphtheriae]
MLGPGTGNCGPVVTAAGFKQVEDNRGGLEVEFERGAKRVKSSGQANLLPLCSEVVGQQVSPASQIFTSS